MTQTQAAPVACSRCASPVEDGDLRCAVCALPVPVARAAAPAQARSKVLRCTECGASIAYDANQNAPACAFCGAVMEVEEPVDPIEVARLRLAFSVSRELATAAVRTWLGKRGFFAPRTLRDEAVLESLHPLCWAAWIVSARARVSWTADSDADARRSAWAPHAGEVPMVFDNLVVSASRGLRHDECSLLVPYYDLARAVVIDGAAEPPPGDDEPAVIESFDAQRSAARQQIYRAMDRVAKTDVQKHIPGKRFRNIHVSCLLERQTTERVALPAWVLAYRYRRRPYRAVVHGQRPEIVFGTSPTDWTKVALVVGGAVLAVLAVIAVILLIGR
jgi:hypothetical protein